jgi:hypothetical protein
MGSSQSAVESRPLTCVKQKQMDHSNIQQLGAVCSRRSDREPATGVRAAHADGREAPEAKEVCRLHARHTARPAEEDLDGIWRTVRLQADQPGRAHEVLLRKNQAIAARCTDRKFGQSITIQIGNARKR